jgi:Flp pilus assembly protein TadG
MKRLLAMWRDKRGAGAIEFALIAPALLAMLMGVTQLGTMYFARADLRHAIAAGARQAQIFPRPTTATITSTITGRMHRLQANKITGPTITYDRDANGFDYAVIQASYAVPLNFIVYKVPAVTLTETRRVYLQPTS